jgi:hypothetical protein
MKKLISTACLVMTMSSSAIAQYVADYDPAANTLSLPWVKVADNYYSNVVLSVPSGKPWSLLRSGTLMDTAPASSAVYDPATSILSIPAVSIYSSQSTRVQMRSASEESPTLVGGVEVSLANGNWSVMRAGSSTRVTSTRDVDPIKGTILDRFNVECKVTTSGTTTTETCTNNGFVAGQAFGLDVDGNGTQDQVWKVHDSSQCLTIQANTWDSVPHDADTWLGDDTAEAGTLKAEIYTHPDGLYIMRYGLNKDWLSCIVTPVSGVSSVVLNNSSNSGAITLSSTSLSGEVGAVLNFYILGGTPPYTVISENNALASVSFGSATANLGQLVSVTLNSTGQSNSDSASTQIFVFDWFQQHAAIPVTINKVTGTTGTGGTDSSPATMSITPATATDLTVGTRFLVRLTGGTPPYHVFNPLKDYIEVSRLSSNIYEVHLVGLPLGATELTGGVEFYDSGSTTIQSNWLSISISGSNVLQYNTYK